MSEHHEKGLTKEFRAAHDDIDEALHKLRSFLFLSFNLALDIPGNTREANALVALLDVCGDKVEEAQAANERAFQSQGGTSNSPGAL